MWIRRQDLQIRTSCRPLLLSILMCSLLSCQSVAEAPRSPIPEHSATIPASRSERWEAKNLRQVKAAEKLGVELLFLGDSLTNRWKAEGAQVWEEFYGDRKAYNLGSGGDRTENTLWRLEHGEIERLQPRLVVLMIGTNNLAQKGDSAPDTPREIADGIDAIVRQLQRKMADTHILVLATFPRARKPRQPLRKRVVEISPMLAELDDGDRVHFLDIADAFLDENDIIPEDVMADALHLSEKGYRLWAEAIEDTVSKLLNESR